MKLLIVTAALALFAGVASAATHIQDTLYLNDGVTPMHGTIVVTGPNGGSTPPSTQPVTIGDSGAVDFYLVGCPGCKYTAQYNLTNPAGVRTQQFQETWIVPAASTILTVRMLLGGSAAPYYLISREQINPAGLLPGQMWLWDGSSMVAMYPSQSSIAGMLDPGAPGVLKRVSLNTTDVVPGNSADFVKVDGTSGPPPVTSVAGRSGDIALGMPDVAGLNSALSGKAPLVHAHNNLYASAAGKADGFYCIQILSGVPTLTQLGCPGSGSGGGGSVGVLFDSATGLFDSATGLFDAH